ncbi:MAG: hypothetical protein KJO31_17095, partial [Gammaproteobacteria bacterium]|nr:hypothetical protein [Gammaproteobacteria bacterium]
PLGHGDAVLGKQFFRLIFVKIHCLLVLDVRKRAILERLRAEELAVFWSKAPVDAKYERNWVTLATRDA